MFRIIATFLDYAVGPELFQDGVIELKMHPKSFVSKEDAINFIKVDEVNRIKEQFAEEGGVSPSEIDANYSEDGKQSYIDISADFGVPLGEQYFGRYIYRIVKE